MKEKNNFQLLSHSAYEQLILGARILKADSHGPKVYELADGTMLKLFRRKRLISYATIYPYAQRFYDNCFALKKMAIPCPSPISLLKIPSIKRTAVHYMPLPGETIRALIKKTDNLDPLREKLGSFINHLHTLGIYFRSVHMGNIVLTPNNELGLIDIADLKIKKRSLSDSQRARNLKHIARYKDESNLILSSTQFQKNYLK